MSDYTIDWSATNVDGNNTISGPDGTIGVSVATPQNGEGKQWFVENGMLKNWDVTHDSSADITFSEEVTDVKFTLLDVDRLDEITIMTKDADGNPVAVQFEATGVHDVNGNVVTGTQTNAPGPGETNNAQDIEICIPGPLKSFWIVLDDGPERSYSGTVAVSDITFNIAPTEDGYVDGTSGDDTIDVAYVGDPDGDQIDNNDALLPGEAAQDDIVLAGGGNDLVMANDGDDEIYGGSGHDTLCGQDGDDVIYGGSGNDILEGMNDNDVMFGGYGSDTIYGDAGNDIATGGAGGDKMYGGSGEDLLSGAKGNDLINGGTGNDEIYGGGGADSILGGAGDDVLVGGNMSYNGTQDFNELSAGDLIEGQYIGEGMTITSGDPTNPVMVFDSANPTGGDNDLATGNLGNVLILSEDRDGSDPDDNAGGGKFNINFEAPATVTSLTLLDADGGAWVKYYDVNGNLLQQVDVTTANNGQHVVSTNLTNVGSIEVILGASGAIDNISYSINPDDCDTADVISGGDGADYIEGNAGNDDLSGDAGNDTVYGGAGDDDIFGGTGEDFLLGGDGDDTIEGGDDDDTLCGQDGDDVLSGGAGNDILEGMNNNDVLFGGTGNDTLYGDSGDDELTGGEGADIIKGGSGSDIIYGGAGDTVHGGATGSDHDVLDLTGQGAFYLENVVSDTATGGNGNGINGTVVFVDGDGSPTGETLTFNDIEDIIGDEVNRGPNAGDDTATVDEDGSVDINVLGNDSDPDGDDLTVTEATSPDGTVTINADGTITFEPNDNFNGETTITYTVDDGNGGTDTAIVTVTVNPVNDAPDAVNDSDVTDEDTAVTVDLLANDTDVDGDTLTVTGATVPAEQGTLVDNGDGTVTFTPAPDFNGDATISYEISDGNGGTDSAVHVITVEGVQDAPDANDDTAETDEDTPVTIDVLDNDSDPDGDPLTVTEATSPNGTVEINPDGTITFTPDENFNGETTISYTVTDPDGNEDTATVTVTVASVNDAPDAVNDSDTTAYNTAVTVDLLANDFDVDGDDIFVVDATVPADQGTLVNNGDGTVTFTPVDGFTGDATISYTIQDEEGLQDSAIHVIVVQAGVLDGTVEGTAGNDLIDVNYVGDPDGDMVDNNDAILPGDVGDDDLIYGYGGNDTILAGDGDDEVYGGSGDDVIEGNAGNDSIQGNGGNDSILGGEGDDIIRGGQGNDTIDGEGGNDMIFGGAGNDVLDGGAGDDKIEGGSGDDTIIGGAGNDDLWGASGDDSVDGGAGNDTIATAEGNDIVEGGDGDDIIDTGNDENPLSGQNLPDVGYPGVYPSDLDPNDDLDTVFGGAGNDSISTGDDNDTIFGGTGEDVIDAGVDDDLVYGGDDNDTIIGSEGNDEIYGDDGDDTIYGGLVPGGPGDALNLPDDLDGDGDSNDSGEDLVTDNNNDTLFGGAGNDTIFGADDDDTLFGGVGDDVLDGGVDDDTLYGGDGNDTITGGQGNDDQFGGFGSDTFLGGNGGDVVVGGEDADGLDVDVLDLTGSNVDFITYVDGDPEAGTVTFEDGSTMTFSEIENVIPCFTPGTTIATPKGERLVEELREGDRIITRDNGIQEIRWTGRKEMSGKSLMANPHLKPILIRSGSLGNGLPERDMLVSPNHRMLVASDKTQLYFEEREVLAAAKHLVGSEGIHAVDVMGTAYIHFMFDRHEVVLSNGAWTESFQPGDYSLKGIGNAQRTEIFELFPELQDKQGLEGYQSARRALKKHEAKLLVK